MHLLPLAGRRALGVGALAGVLGPAALAPAHAAPISDAPVESRVTDVPAAAGSSLEGTPQVDTDAAQRNVELLLETRSDGEHRPLPGTRRPLPGSPADVTAAGAQPGGAAQSVPTPPQSDERAANVRVVRAVVQFVREHRLWLLVAVALVALAALAAQLWRHRRVGASDQQLRQLADQQRLSRRRRRSSRH